ncbi:50S ribosomal protein L1 [Candidatus Woesearchaeota archaeon]|nr:50S ribosomal protein L1 [Candidatus Woesearchaeota archaeon]
MDKKQIVETLKSLRADAKERKFTQTVELIVNLKDLNLKNPDEQVEFFTTLPHGFTKKKICAIVGGELVDEAKKVCDFVITQGDLDKYKADKKAAKKLADEYAYFIAQANIMGQIAGVFGRIFGPRGKMPNPKAGCVVPPKASLQPLYDRLQNTIKISAKKFPVIQLPVGKLDMTDVDLAENIDYLYSQIEHHLPKERHNVRGTILKLTMGKPVRL